MGDDADIGRHDRRHAGVDELHREARGLGRKGEEVDHDAIADLAVENELEMRSATADPVFLLKRKIELKMEQTYRDYFSKYSMVTFREDLPYSYAMKRGRAQDEILMKYAAGINSMAEFDEQEVLRLIHTLDG